MIESAGSPPDGRLESLSDASLIETSMDQPALFATLFDRHAAVIHRYLARRTDGRVADDLLADTFTIAFAKRSGYDLGHPSALPWLYGIASNMLARHRVGEQRALRLLGAVGADRAASSHEDRVVSNAVAEATRRELAIALGNLSAGDRDVLLLIAWEELTYEEVAQALAIPIGTVRSRLHRARIQLRPLLERLTGRELIREVLNGD